VHGNQIWGGVDLYNDMTSCNDRSTDDSTWI